MPGSTHGNGIVLLIEDDIASRVIMTDALRVGGFNVVAAACAASALMIIDQGVIQPDAILTDYNLAGDVNGLVLGTEIRRRLGRDIPLVVLTGDVSSEAAEALYASDCTHLTKPVHSADILQHLVRVTSPDASNTIGRSEIHEAAITICIIDDEVHARESIQELLEGEGYVVITFPDAETFLAADLDHLNFCLLLDLKLPGLSGIELLSKMQSDDVLPTAIVLTAIQEPQEAVRAIRAGAIDFLIKPVRRHNLLAGIDRLVAHMVAGDNPSLLKRRARKLIGKLTERQLQVMSLILAGFPNKIIAADLGVSQRTVENHRAAIMRRTETRSLPELAKLSIAAGMTRST
jgi:two-component system CheB/CheR fusion protein